jgi:hypothetical protein
MADWISIRYWADATSISKSKIRIEIGHEEEVRELKKKPVSIHALRKSC